MTRHDTLAHISARSNPSVLVIGGGINGISVFRELALNGVDVVLAEKADFCSGASAALSRMVHGGLRYLENGEFKLVRESLLERDRLLANAPHYVRPLPTTVPIFSYFDGLANGAFRFLKLTRKQSRRGALVIKLGLTLYDVFTRGRGAMPPHKFHSRAQTLSNWPAMNPDARASATYYDAWVSRPERLGLELLQEGIGAGGLAINYANVARDGAGNLVLHDTISNTQIKLAPSLVVNATGGWIDLTNTAIGATNQPMMGGTKGSHLVVTNRELYDALAGNMIYYENEDGRICIVFPYLGNVLVGSTDVRVDDPDTVTTGADDQKYILQSLAVVFPKIKISPEEIAYQFVGVRPLPTSDAAVTGAIPRDHFCEIVEGSPPTLCMIGGKWTTFRSFGALAADMVFERLDAVRIVDTANRPIGGGKDFPTDFDGWIRNAAERSNLPQPRVANLLERYGSDAEKLLAIAGANDVIADHSPEELNWLISNEHVEKLSDLLLRRTTIGITGQLTNDTIDASLAILAKAKCWNAAQAQAAREEFLIELKTKHGIDRDALAQRDHRISA
jgi:glycerol-3-phosphate dehydrogenase